MLTVIKRQLIFLEYIIRKEVLENLTLTGSSKSQKKFCIDGWLNEDKNG